MKESLLRLIRQDNMRYVLLIVGVSLLAHLLLLLNDGVYWDGWLIYTNLLEGDWDFINVTYTERGGLPIYQFFHWVLGFAPNIIFAYKLAAYLFILFSAIFVFFICLEVGLNRQESVLISLFSMVFPASQVAFELIIVPYYLSYFMFLFGYLAAIKAVRISGLQHWYLRISALLLMALSFRMYSLLVLFYPFCLVLLIQAIRIKQQGFSLRTLTSTAIQHSDYILLPIIIWFLSGWLFPPYGLYADADPIQLTLDRLPRVWHFLNNAFLIQLMRSVQNLVLTPLIGVLVVVAALAAGWWGYAKKRVDLKMGIRWYWFLLFGVMFYFAGMFPYVVVGKSPLYEGWSTRHAILTNIGIALVLLGILKLAFLSRGDKMANIGLGVTVFLVLSFSFSFNVYYADWQARWIKDSGIMENLKSFQEIGQGASILIVEDDFPRIQAERYRPYEWSSMVDSVWLGQQRIAFEMDRYTIYYFTDHPNILDRFYDNADLFGCRARLDIKPTEFFTNTNRFELVGRYFVNKLLGPEETQEFLAAVAKIDVRPINTSLAENCVNADFLVTPIGN